MKAKQGDRNEAWSSEIENAGPLQAPQSKWKVSKSGDGDTAMALFTNPEDLHEYVDPKEARRLLWKIDLMILPYLAVCYAFFYIDKVSGFRDNFELCSNIWNSRRPESQRDPIQLAQQPLLLWIFGMGTSYQFYVAEVSRWGFFLMLQAACKNFTALAVLRTLAGAAEACSDPGFLLVTSMWYTRKEQPVRLGLWYTANGFGIAIGGLLGYGIGSIKGDLPSWKYEFIIIGALCCAWGIVIFLFLPDSPVTAPFLNQRDRRRAVERVRSNQTGIENKQLKPYQIKEAFLDYKLYLFFLLGVVCNIPNGGISNFGTIIIHGFGFSTLVTTLMQIPYGIIIAVSILLCVYLNNKFENRRCLFIILFLLPNIAGAFGLRFLAHDQKAGRLICYYLTGPYNAAFVLVLSMQIANTAVSHLIEVVVISLLGFLLWRENKRRDDVQSQQEGGLEGRNLDSTAFSDMTDRENLK
ncbi:MFS allantoate transporter [Trichophyton violaceum]|uniref:MFS allantoate transporter n=1 Tax=Trichophyton violaceum TaxID=34388 RepID=A0A178FBF2_TRIVO|nr:MFS allantoate transporter [Trichophyton violaceum]